MRLQTSIAKVNHGRPIGCRVSSFNNEDVGLGMIDLDDLQGAG